MSSNHHPPKDLDLNSDVSPTNMVTNNKAPIQNEIRVSESETLGFMDNQEFNLNSGVMGNDRFSWSGYRRDYGFLNTGDGHGGRVGFDGVPGGRVGTDLSGGLDSLYYPGSRDGGRVGYNVVPESVCVGRIGLGAGACVSGRVGDVFNPGSGGGGRGGYNVVMENYGIDVGMGGRVDALFNAGSGHGGRVGYNGVHEEMSGDHVRIREGADLGSRVDALFNPVGGDRGRFGYNGVHENMSGDHVRMGAGVDLGGRVDALFSPVNGDRGRVGFNAVPENFIENRVRIGDGVDISDRVDAIFNPVNGDRGRVGLNAVPESLDRDHVGMGASVNLGGRVDALFNPPSKDEGRVGYDVVLDNLSLESVGMDVDLGDRVDALFNSVSEDRGRVGFKVVQDNMSLDRVGMGVNVNFGGRVDALFNTVNGDGGRVGCTAVPENSSRDCVGMDVGGEIESRSVRGLWSENKDLKVGVGESSVLKTADVKIGVKDGQIMESNISEVEGVEGVHENQTAVNADFVGVAEEFHDKEETKISQKVKEGINAQVSEELLIPVGDEGKTGVPLPISLNEVVVRMDSEMENSTISAIGTSCKNDVLEGLTSEIPVKDDTKDVGTDMDISPAAKIGKIHMETPKQNTKPEILRSVMQINVEGEFSITDMVWGKVRSHPWWPGQIFKSSDASAAARKQPKKDNCYLVAYFGDASFAWNEALALKPFHANFTRLDKQSTQESFQVAVDCALDEASRRVEYALSCPCVPEVGDNIIETQIIDNAGICIEERKRDVSEKVSVITSFEPEKLVEYIKRLALDVCSGRDRLEHVIAQAQLLAFNRSKGYAQLPEFYVYSGFTGIMIADVIPISRMKEEAISRKKKPKKQDSSSDEYEQVEDGSGSSKNKKMTGSSRKRKSESQNSSSDEYDHVEDVSISRKNKRMMDRTKTKPSDVDNGTSIKLSIPTSGKKRMRGRPRKETKTVACVPHGSKPKVGERIRKRGRPRKETKTVVQSADESDEGNEDYCSDESDDENYSLPRIPQGSKCKVGGRARRCVSKRSKSSTSTKFSDEYTKSDEDLDIEQSDKADGAESSHTTKGSQIRGLATVKYNRTPIEMLSQLYLIAQNPLKLHKFLSDTVEFFTDFRNSISGANWSGKTEEDPLNKSDGNDKLESEKIEEDPLEKNDTNGKLENIEEDQLQKSGANGKLEQEKIEEDALMNSDADGKSEYAKAEKEELKKSDINGKLESENLEEDVLKNSYADGKLESAKTEEGPLKKSDTNGNLELEKIEEGATKSDLDEKLESAKTEEDLLKKSGANGKLGSTQIKEESLMKSDTNGNLESEKIEEGATKSDADEKLKSAKIEEDLLKKSDANGKLGFAQIKEDPLKKSDEDSSPSGDSELILNFSNAESIPSEAALNEIFNHFSSLKHSETEILKKKKRARVVFGIRSEAEEAFSKAGKFSIFGPALATYRLRYLPATPPPPASAHGVKEVS